MKNELVIEILKELWRYEHTDKYTEAETREALDMAITALSADGDLVSRKAVLQETVYKNSIWNTITDAKGRNLKEIIAELPTIQQVVCDDDCEHCSWVECPLVQKAEQSYSWCKDCKEYDTEKHCCHRYSSFIRETLQGNIDAVLEDIKEDILKEINNHSFFSSSQKGLAIAYKIIDKHMS